MPYNYDEIAKKLKKLGYREVRQKGSHVIFSNLKTTFPVPSHGGKQISNGVEKQILKLLKMSKDEFDSIK